MRIVTDAQVLGRIGEFAQPGIRKKADQTMQELATNVARATAEQDSMPPRVGGA